MCYQNLHGKNFSQLQEGGYICDPCLYNTMRSQGQIAEMNGGAAPLNHAQPQQPGQYNFEPAVEEAYMPQNQQNMYQQQQQQYYAAPQQQQYGGYQYGVQQQQQPQQQWGGHGYAPQQGYGAQQQQYYPQQQQPMKTGLPAGYPHQQMPAVGPSAANMRPQAAQAPRK